MPRRTLGPFPDLAGLSAIDINSAEMLDILERADLVNGVLADAGCNCNGHAAGNQRDEHWGADLSELVCRTTPHSIHSLDGDGKPRSQTVSIRLETLRVEVDTNNEICAWIYTES